MNLSMVRMELLWSWDRFMSPSWFNYLCESFNPLRAHACPETWSSTPFCMTYHVKATPGRIRHVPSLGEQICEKQWTIKATVQPIAESRHREITVTDDNMHRNERNPSERWMITKIVVSTNEKVHRRVVFLSGFSTRPTTLRGRLLLSSRFFPASIPVLPLLLQFLLIRLRLRISLIDARLWRFSVGAEGLSVSCGSLPAIVLVLELSLRLFGFKVLYSSHWVVAAQGNIVAAPMYSLSRRMLARRAWRSVAALDVSRGLSSAAVSGRLNDSNGLEKVGCAFSIASRLFVFGRF